LQQSFSHPDDIDISVDILAWLKRSHKAANHSNDMTVTLNLQRIQSSLETLRSLSSFSPPAVTALDIRILDSVSSTNQTLWELRQQGAKSGTVAIATQQTAGRGQWGREWQSTPGGLYLSMGIDCHLDSTQHPQLTMATAWGIASQLREYNIPVQLKWPNDLILNKRKLGGILTETKISQQQIIQAVIGVGINWNNVVPETGINLQYFLSESTDPPKVQSLELLAALVIRGIEVGLQLCLQGQIEHLLKSYTELLNSLGRRVKIDGNSGTVVGVTPTGELRVQLNSINGSGCNREVCIKPGTISLGYD
jgi:BirA family biotin operon repressor/biotin-[acetyl-CoA-carboxylase] ligase